MLGARFYIPRLGRFLTQDPIGHQGGLNLYAYCCLSVLGPPGLLLVVNPQVTAVAAAARNVSRPSTQKSYRSATRVRATWYAYAMGALSWVRLARRVPGIVRQRELANVESLIDAEAGRQPTYNLFVLSCAIPAGIATFGGLSVFVAWLSGNTGLPLILGTALTAVLTAGAWFIFHRLYRSIPPSKRHLRDLILKFSQRYASFGNMIVGEKSMPDEFATLLDEAAGIYLRHGSGEGSASAKAVSAIEDALTKLLEVAVQHDAPAQTRALAWAQPLLVELRLLDQSLTQHALTAGRDELADPLASLREARTELETSNSAIEELHDHLRTR